MNIPIMHERGGLCETAPITIPRISDEMPGDGLIPDHICIFVMHFSIDGFSLVDMSPRFFPQNNELFV